jgi:hypothetical protein
MSVCSFSDSVVCAREARFVVVADSVFNSCHVVCRNELTLTSVACRMSVLKLFSSSTKGYF